MPNVTIEINAGPDASPDTYVEDGYVIAAGQAASLPGVIPDGLTVASDSQSDGAYLRTTNSNDWVFVESATPGKPFGLQSIQLEGFVNSATGSGVVREDGAPVTFHFVGYLKNSAFPVEFFFTTNNVLDFEKLSVDADDQRYRLPAEFASGLMLLSWQATDGTNVWGAFDNIVLSGNSAPVVTGVQSATQADGTVAGQILASDADGDSLRYDIFVPAGGQPTPGVILNADGSFSVERTAADDDLLPGQSREVTFQYTVSDGLDPTGPQTVTVSISGLAQGADIRGGNHPQKLCGTEAGERIWGGNSGDTLCGAGGADTLDGANGNDLLYGGDGRDKLIGGNGSDTLYGDAGNDVLDGGNGPDRLDGGAGDDTLTGGAGPDEFYFGANWGHDRITDFDPKNEHIHFAISPTLGSWGDFLALKAQGYIRQVGADVLIDDRAGNTLTLANVKLTSLAADDFLFG